MRFICLTLLLLLAACGQNEAAAPLQNKALVRLSESEARGLDPQMVSDLTSIRITSDLFEGLTRFNGSGIAEAGLAESWTVSQDGRRWSFRLRPGLRFSDGRTVDASVFAQALSRIRDEKSGSPHSALFSVIKTIEAPNGRDVIITLANPFPQLPALLAHPAMAALPFHRIIAKKEGWTADRPLISSGPYRMTEWKLNQQMTLSANPFWHGGRPATQKVVWKPMDNTQSGMRLMLAGGADISTEFPSGRLEWLKQSYPKMVHSSDYLATYYFAFNTRKPPFDDARVRRALNMAVDRDWIARDMIAAGNKPAWGLLPPGLSGNQNYRPEWSNWNKEKRISAARQMLKQAGYGPGRPLRFEIRFNSSAEHRKVSVALATMWRELGVEALLLNSEASLHFDSMKRADFALARSGWVADLPAPENFLSIHRSDAGVQNYSGYTNPSYDAALSDALAEPDAAKRSKKMRAAEAILMEDTPILPLYFYVTRALVQPNISGWQDNIANVHPSYNLAKR
jgi:oligopeptide transport system substrate-binding protein